MDKKSTARRYVIGVSHVLVLMLSVLLLYAITYDTLHYISLLDDPRYLSLQLWICIFFIVETVVEWALSDKRRRGVWRMLLMVALCVPYISLVHRFRWPVSVELYCLLRVMPLVRAAVVLVVTWGMMERNRVTGMFGSYMIILIFTLYVLSLMFYVEEHPVNPMVYSYWQSLWYSVMQMNTCGSDISPMTSAGKVIGVVLSAEGLILFPVFTVYFTHAFGRIRGTGAVSGPSRQ